MFSKIKEKNPKLGLALDTLLKSIIGALIGFISAMFVNCKSFDFSAEKLDVQVQSKSDSVLENTFNTDVEKNNGDF